MDMEEEIRKILLNTRSDLVSSLNSLDEHSKKVKKQQMCTKLKIVLGLISQNNKEQLIQQLAQYNDPDLPDVIKSIFEHHNDNVSIKSASHVQVKPSPAKSTERKSKINTPNQKSLQQSNRSFSQSILKGILGNIIKNNQKEAKEMILPKNQPKCVYDPVKKKYIIQGQQQEEQTAPKPPPKKGANKTQSTAKTSQKKSQIQEMMAPPAFKRKGVNKKEEVKKPKQVQMSFEVFQQKITNGLQQCISRLLELFQQQLQHKVKSIQPKLPFSCEELTMLRSFSQQIRSAQQISDTMLTRLYSSYIDSQFENQAIASMIKKLVQLQQTNNQVFNLLWSQNQKLGQFHSHDHSIQQNSKASQKVNSLEQQVKILRLQNQKFKLQLEMATKGLADEREKYKLNLESQVSENSMIKSLIEQKRQQIEQLSRQKLLRQNQNSQLKRQLSTKKQEIRAFKNQIALLKQKFVNFEITLHTEQQNLLSSIIKKSSQVSLMEQLNQAIIAQNELFLAIQAKRISIYTQGKQTGNQSMHEQETSNTGHLLQLSDSLSKVVQHYQGQISLLKKQVTFLSENYQVAKAQGNKIQQSLGAQNQTLQRSLNRMKSLMEDYKQTKQQLEIKIAQIENQNMALQRQIAHIRKQHNYTKQVLQQNIRSSHDNTATMRQQLQQEIKQLQERLEQKEMNERLHNQQIKQTGEQINQLIGQNKAKSIKIINLQKDIKGLRLQLDEKIMECSQLLQKLAQYQKQLQNRQKRISQQRTKNDTTTKSQKKRIKQLQQQVTTYKNQLKQQHKIYSQQFQSTQQTKKQNQQLLILIEQTTKQIQQTQSTNLQLTSTLSIKQNQIHTLQQQLEQYHIQILQHQQHKNTLQQQHLNTIQQIKSQLSEYKNLYDSQCANTQHLLQNIQLYKEELGRLHNQTHTRMQYLLNNITQDHLQIQQLTNKLSQYEKLTNIMNNKIQQLQNNNNNTQQQLLTTISELQQKNNQYQKQTKKYKQQLQTITTQHNTQIHILQTELSQKLSQLSILQQQYNRKMTIHHQQYQAKTNTLLQQLEAVQQQRNQYEQINIQMQKQIQVLQKQVTTLTNDLNTTNNNIQLQYRHNTQQIQKLTNAITQLHTQLQNKSHTITQLQNTLSQQSLTKITLQRQLLESQHNYTEYNNRMDEVLIKLDNKQNQLSLAHNKIQSLQQELNRIRNNRQNQEKIRSINKSQVKLVEQQYTNNGNYVGGGNNVNIKDKLIHNIQSAKDQINKKQQSIQKLTLELKNSHNQISQYKETLLTNTRIIQELHTKLSDRQRIIPQLQAENRRLLQQLKQYKKMNQQLQQLSIKKLSHQDSGQNNLSLQDSQEMQQLIIVLQQNITQKQKQIEALQRKMLILETQLQENKQINIQLGKEKSQLEDLYNKKSDQAQKTIQKLQIQVREMKKFQISLQNMQTKYKDLQLQNSELIKQKIQILKTRDQILNKLHSLQKNQSDNKALQPKQNTSQAKVPKRQQYHSSISAFNPTTTKKGPQNQNGQQKSNGFFGSLSSLFLTQTQLERIGKNRK